ncbi:hypothetical protein RJ639_032715 [Escallonia herrerae]|uniref:Uncharacterized protein n=1 Tax=Escallonia herrerae TaxID=1293975 RepID=A0AA88WSX4_9ASTE|nr:hypothetical protein RJ639_032715 [Escallonia herrerae]
MKEALRYLAGVAGPSGYGSNSTAEQVTQDCSCLLPSHHHLTAIVTGATSGIGAETARVLAKRGVRIVVPVRDLKKGAQLKERIQKESPEAKIVLLEIDLSSFASIKRFCSEFLSLNLPLNILISGCGLGQTKLMVDVKSLCRNNAGKFSNKLEFSEDKIEMTFATNYLGKILNSAPVCLSNIGGCTLSLVSRALRHFLLTELLLEKMIETAAQTGTQGRVVNVSSVIHSWVERDNFYFNQMLQPNNINSAYNLNSNKRLDEKLLDAHLPITSKEANRDSLFFVACKLLKSTSQGASTTCYVALSQQIEGVSGSYFADCNESYCSSLANDESEALQLWRQTCALINRRLRQPRAKDL